jgi:uncharacterized DUF497 family protein
VSTVRFAWDKNKDLENQNKHGVSFAEAQYAFADPRRVIAEDLSHSGGRSAITALAKSEAEFSLCDSHTVAA